MEKAKRLAVSKDKKEQDEALRIFASLARVQDAEGEEALVRYGNLCLDVGGAQYLKLARDGFTLLKDKGTTRSRLFAPVGLARVDAADGKQTEACTALDRFLGQQDKTSVSVDAAYWLGCRASA